MIDSRLKLVSICGVPLGLIAERVCRHSTTDTVLPSQSAKVHLSDSYQVTGRLKLLDLMVGVIEGRPVDEAKYDRKSL